MSDPGPLGYAVVFAGTLALSLFLTPLAMRYALRREIVDLPGGHKGHVSPVPYLGGVAIVASFVAVVLAAAATQSGSPGLGDLGVILGCGLALAVMGLVDDLRGLSPWLRLALEAGIGLVVWKIGFGPDLSTVEAVDMFLTVAWVVGVTNSLNLLDNMDGLSAGVAVIAACFFFVIAATNGQFLVATLAIALAGCAAGFLRSNRYPAKIYMGDAGSLFVGFVLSVVGVRLRFDGPTEVTAFVPILVLGVPLFDTVLVTVNRLIHRRSPLSGGRDHTSHRLVHVGLPVPAAVGLIYLGAASLGWLALVMANVGRGTGYLLMGWVVVVAGVLGVMLSLVPVYESSRRRHLVITELGQEMPSGRAVERPERAVR